MSGSSPWRVGRVDLRSSVAANAWPVARLELEHAERGRVTDIGSAPGAFDAAFVAASHILGIAPTLLSYNVRSDERDGEGALQITIDIEIEIDGKRGRGSNNGQDLVECSLNAWLDAAHAASGTAP
ncbi:MAG: alpha-isopropylmalate synthase regulatory domain-containing protein [Pseudomonadota bacterium]